MEKFRKHGKEPYYVEVIHGGPGAPGDVAQLARELSIDHGVLEPLLSSKTIDGQVKELRSVLDDNADLPVRLIGHSYGAWLSIMFTANHPVYVSKLILVSSGPFKNRYSSSVMDKRLERLNDEEKEELFELFEALSNSSKIQNENVIGKLYRLMDKTDSYELIDHKNEMIEFQQKVYQKVWDEAEELRHDEKLIEYARGLDCPVVAIHGAYDPHPYEGVKEPLSDILDDFKFVLLDRCGHYPWYERYARDEFLQIIRDELE